MNSEKGHSFAQHRMPIQFADARRPDDSRTASRGDLLSSVLRRTGSRQETRVSSMGEIIHRSTATFVCQGTILTGNTSE